MNYVPNLEFSGDLLENPNALLCYILDKNQSVVRIPGHCLNLLWNERHNHSQLVDCGVVYDYEESVEAATPHIQLRYLNSSGLLVCVKPDHVERSVRSVVSDLVNTLPPGQEITFTRGTSTFTLRHECS